MSFRWHNKFWKLFKMQTLFVITCPERSSLDKGHTAWLILTLGHALDGGPGTLFTLGSDRWCVHQEIIVNSLNFDYFLFFSFFFLVLDLDKSFGSKLLPALMMMSWSADSLGPFSLIKNWITCKKLNKIIIISSHEFGASYLFNKIVPHFTINEGY